MLNPNPWHQKNVFVGKCCFLLQLMTRINFTRKVRLKETEGEKPSSIFNSFTMQINALNLHLPFNTDNVVPKFSTVAEIM